MSVPFHKFPWWDIEIRDDGWVFFGEWHLPQKYQGRKRALRDFRQLEKDLVRAGFKGWIGGAYINDLKMMKLIIGVGGKAYHCDGESIAFYKDLKGEGNEYTEH